MKIGVVGFGNLGRSLVEGLVGSGTAGADIYVCEKSAEGCAAAVALHGANATDDVNSVVRSADVIFLTVKSYVFEELATIIDQGALAGKTVVSFMAGMQLEQLRPLIGDAVLVRAMPSLAIAACDGVIGYTAAPEAVAAIFHRLGYAFETEPENIEKVMAFSSCGLGFAAYLIDAFAEAGEKMGFSPETCVMIASQTFRNAVDRGDYKGTVKAVATPGGATEQGVLHMGSRDLPAIVGEAVQKAYDRMK